MPDQEFRNNPVLPTPALIIPLGKHAIKNVINTLPFYFRNDDRRKYLTTIFAPMIKNLVDDDDSTGFSILDQNSISSYTLDESNYSELTLNDVLMNLNAIKGGMDTVWHTLRSHQNMIEAGYAGEIVPDPNIIIMANLWDDSACNALLPILYYLKNLTASVDLPMIQVIMTTACFTNDLKASAMRARIFRVLGEIEGRILEPDKTESDPLLEILKIEKSSTLDRIRFLILDTLKENKAFISNEDELNIIIENYLLCSLNGEFAKEVTSVGPELYEMNKPFFASAGASSIIYNPDPLIEYCSRRLGAEYITMDYWPEEGPDKNLIDSKINEIKQKTGSINAWSHEILEKTPHIIINKDNEWEFHFSIDDLVLNSPVPDEVTSCNWVTLITNYLQKLEIEIIPSTSIIIDNFSKNTTSKVLNAQKKFLDEILQQVEIHPNVLQIGMMSLQLWNVELNKRKSWIGESKESEISNTEELKELLEIAKQNIISCINSFPKVPKFFRFIPKGKIRKILTSLYALIYFRKQYKKLDEERSNVLNLVELLAISPIKEKIFDNLLEILDLLEADVIQTQENLVKLSEKLKSLKTELQNEYPKFIPGKAVDISFSNFRFFPADETFTISFYEDHRPPIENTRQILLGQYKLLADWKNKSIEELKTIILEYGSVVFSNLKNLDLANVLEKTTLKNISENEKQKFLTGIENASVPLIRPNWDLDPGSNSRSFSTFLVDSNQNQLFEYIHEDHQKRRQVIYSGDMYNYLFSKVILQIPLKTLEHIIKPGETIWQQMSSDEKRKIDIVPDQSKVIPKVTISEIDGPEGDKVMKKFMWTFKPKGSSEYFNQVIEIKISKKRYSEFKNKDRFIGKWNLYSEEEMPEVRELTDEFARLHKGHNWSTFNQAFNILTFVQSCIPYSYDWDTTSHKDWARYPIETLMDGTGDCEDVAILCASVLARLGYSTVLLYYVSNSSAHVAFGVQAADNLKGDYIINPENGKKYYYGEATAKGWTLGQIPTSYQNNPPEQILPVMISIKE